MSTINILMSNRNTIKASDIIGLKVVTLNDGKELHSVQDLLFDPQENVVRALLINIGGWFSNDKVLMLRDIHSIGKDAVVIQSERLLTSANRVPKPVTTVAKGEKYLNSRTIITEGGTNMGKISDMDFDPKTGNVIAFEVTPNTLVTTQSGKKYIKIEDIITVGKNATIVKDSTTSTDETGMNDVLENTKLEEHTTETTPIQTKGPDKNIHLEEQSYEEQVKQASSLDTQNTDETSQLTDPENAASDLEIARLHLEKATEEAKLHLQNSPHSTREQADTYLLQNADDTIEKNIKTDHTEELLDTVAKDMQQATDQATEERLREAAHIQHQTDNENEKLDGIEWFTPPIADETEYFSPLSTQPSISNNQENQYREFGSLGGQAHAKVRREREKTFEVLDKRTGRE